MLTSGNSGNDTNKCLKFKHNFFFLLLNNSPTLISKKSLIHSVLELWGGQQTDRYCNP